MRKNIKVKELRVLFQRRAKHLGWALACVIVFTLSGFAAGIIQWLFHLGMNFAYYLTGLL